MSDDVTLVSRYAGMWHVACLPVKMLGYAGASSSTICDPALRSWPRYWGTTRDKLAGMPDLCEKCRAAGVTVERSEG
jgi:hypothetical protein